MKRLIPLLMLLLGLVIAPGIAVAQGPGDNDETEGLLFRADGSVTIADNDVISTVIVANGDATVEGVVEDALIVISGDAIVRGEVAGDIVMIDGTLSLEQASTVNDVLLVRSSLDRAEGATVAGDIEEQTNFVSFGVGAAVFSVVMWFGVTLAIIVAALLFAWLGSRQLVASGNVMIRQLGRSVLTALVLWIGLPALGVLSFATIVGIPLGGAIFLFVIPALWFLGYLVAGAKLGAVILNALGWEPRMRWPLLAAGLGVLLLQVIGLFPGIGPLVIALAGILGSGALIYRLVDRGQEPQSAEPAR